MRSLLMLQNAGHRRLLTSNTPEAYAIMSASRITQEDSGFTHRGSSAIAFDFLFSAPVTNLTCS